MGSPRRPTDRHVGRRKRAHPRSTQQRNPRLGRARVPSDTPRRARLHAARMLSWRARRRPRMSSLGGPAPSFPQGSQAHPTSVRGTVSLEGRRFEIPSQFAHLKHPRLRYARWDLSNVDLVDARSGAILCPLYPLDKAANASGERRLRKSTAATAPAPRDEVAPLLNKLMAEFAATGLPPPYLPEDEDSSS